MGGCWTCYSRGNLSYNPIWQAAMDSYITGTDFRILWTAQENRGIKLIKRPDSRNCNHVLTCTGVPGYPGIQRTGCFWTHFTPNHFFANHGRASDNYTTGHVWI